MKQMGAITYIRGCKAIYDEQEQKWTFDDGQIVGDIIEICPRCHTHHLSYDCDYCLRPLLQTDFIVSACCGHGVERGYIKLADGRLFREVTNDE